MASHLSNIVEFRVVSEEALPSLKVHEWIVFRLDKLAIAKMLVIILPVTVIAVSIATHLSSVKTKREPLRMKYDYYGGVHERTLEDFSMKKIAVS